MTNLEETSGPAVGHEVAQRWLPALLLLFVGSGCAALIYEVVWFQLLQLSIGSSTVSLSVLLGVFMGGMCLGSLLLPRYIDAETPSAAGLCLPRDRHRRLRHSWCCSWCRFSATCIPRSPGPGASASFLRAVVASVCLVPPTLLMGATLPAIARWVETTPQGVSWLGFFYGGNLAGAVTGSLLAGFYLLPFYDMPTATYAAVALNVLVAVLALGIAARTPHTVVTDEPGRSARAGDAAEAPGSCTSRSRLSGLTALGAEVVWTRILSLIFGATAYTFSLILAVFLVGLGIGSSLGAAWRATCAARGSRSAGASLASA